ncbi:HupE/UreJ protein [Methylosinus sp. sav-2]|uniref:HupE/UreJ family protein n=1 Tax=Methylosinus sp. sav-2 TaxID=2485168 RepID=UPI00047ACD43|nr:HupE/UreJ family protein [Methylosinus sp. sav-2]TDX62814.1 HupE/UreJ protein [Methylosinus sp. sav-2]
MTRRSRQAGVGALFLLLSATSAKAHIIGARLGDFYAGAAHPLTDLRDVTLWVALGMLAGSLGASKARPLLLLFPFGLAAGVTSAMALNATSEGVLLAAGALVLLGALLASDLRIPAAALGGLALVLAAMRGAANAAAIGPETNRLLFVVGLSIAGYVVVTLVSAATLAFRGESADARAWRSIAIRALGSWLAALGLMMGGLALAS